MKKSRGSDYQKELQRLLRKKRIDKGLSQEKLAELLDQIQSFVSKYETGERILDPFELQQVCDALGIKLTSIIRRLENKDFT